jgi:hypothetical protein
MSTKTFSSIAFFAASWTVCTIGCGSPLGPTSRYVDAERDVPAELAERRRVREERIARVHSMRPSAPSRVATWRSGSERHAELIAAARSDRTENDRAAERIAAIGRSRSY